MDVSAGAYELFPGARSMGFLAWRPTRKFYQKFSSMQAKLGTNINSYIPVQYEGGVTVRRGAPALQALGAAGHQDWGPPWNSSTFLY